MGKVSSKSVRYPASPTSPSKHSKRSRQKSNASSTTSQESNSSFNRSNNHHQQQCPSPASSQESFFSPCRSTDFDIYEYIGDRKHCNNDLDDVNYIYPVDDDEIDRVQMQHFMYKHVWGGNFSSPVQDLLQKEDTKILDIGCGSGAWVLEMATEYQNPQFTGIDVAPLYPTEIKPENVTFQQANVLLGLPFEDNTFDFVYIRFMIFAFSVEDWERAIKEVVRVTKPGGWVEIMEKDLYWCNEGPFCKAARTAVAEALRESKNMEIILSPIIPNILSSISNLDSNINHDERSVPFGEWGGKLGTIYRDLYTWGAKNLKTFMKGIGFNEDEWDETVDICMKQLNDRKGFDKIHRFWAMKKLEP
ncbi:hypothetical protein Glove_41g82 [Diversispora epigaea]|uniref:Methyltransferase domain-containing protein n=1 Tax=Diversispora epigaea TaxID=1348612 RepID=A0A397JM16_9GLOM|nr:hypothetical protein Glove_41g82 [Diversispora epigaea]